MSKSKTVTPFGRKMRIMRAERNATLREMSILLGVSPAYLSAVELGKRPVSDKLLANICSKFQLSFDEKGELLDLVNISKISVKIKIGNASENKRQLAREFASSFSDLSEKTVSKLRKLLTE